MTKFTTDTIKEKLFELQDRKYSEFSSGLIPGENNLIGVRIPLLRKFAKEIAMSDYEFYLENSCNNMEYFEETMLKGMVIGMVKVDEDRYFELIQDFVPLIDNWSVNDSFCAGLKRINKCKERAWKFVLPYLESTEEFTLRFGIIILMNYFLTDEYAEEAISHVSRLKHDAYYARMGMAWFMATAYAKYPDITLRYLQNSRFDDWTFNKSIQKMLESYRVPESDKIMLKNMKK